MSRDNNLQGGYVGNLLKDEESTNEFLYMAHRCAVMLSGKYYSVIKKFSVDDVVQEVLCSVLKNNVSYDVSKGKSYMRFVSMLVERKYIDLFRYITGGKRDVFSEVYLGDVIGNGDDSSDDCDLESILGKEDVYLKHIEDDESTNEFLSLVKDFFNAGIYSSKGKLDIHTVVSMRLSGKSYSYIADKYETSYSMVSNLVKDNSEYLLDMYNDYFDCGDYMRKEARKG